MSNDQVVLQVAASAFPVSFAKEHHLVLGSPLWRDARLLPAYAAAVSVLTALLAYLPRWFFGKFVKKDDVTSSEPSDTVVSWRSRLEQLVEDHGGRTIFAFEFVRCVCVLIILVLCALGCVQSSAGAENWLAGMFGEATTGDAWIKAFLCAAYAYTFVLSLTTLTCKSSTAWVVAAHSEVVLLTDFCVNAFRNLWPLMTYTLEPADALEGGLLWAKIVLLGVSSVVIPLTVPRKYIPLDPRNPSAVPNPEQTASIFSLAFYTFVSETIIGFAKGDVSNPSEILPPLADYDAANILVDRSFKHLDTFAGARKQHMFIGLMRVFFREYLAMLAMVILNAVAKFLAPIGINRLLSYIETGGADAFVKPFVWISLLLISPLLVSLCFQWYIFYSTATLVRMQAMLTQLIFEHALRIRLKAEAGSGKDDSTTSGKKKGGNVVLGRINTLIGADMAAINRGRDFLQLFVFAPLQTAISMYFLYLILGWSAFVGMAVMLLSLPFPGLVARAMQGMQKNVMKATDSRVQTVSEMMGILRMVKMFGWEHKMSDRVAEKRAEEVKWIKARELADLLNHIVNFIIPILVMIASYATFTVVMKQDLTPSIVFSSITVFEMLREQLHLVVWLISIVLQGKVSLDRVTEFLHNTELLDEFTETDKPMVPLAVPDGDLIGFTDSAFTWSGTQAADGTQTPSTRNFVLRIERELIFKRRVINLIVGPTGCGKTSILMALLGEMHYVPAGPGSWYNLPRGGGIAYAAQESWVLNATIKHNILFGAVCDEDRYKKVLYQCALEPDLELFEAGDKTEVGEKGLTLSGGQKARVTLARAIYSSAEILLLDDVLAALDVHTSRWIVEKCFQSDLVSGRTVILVTHNVALTSRIADFVVAMNGDGQIASRGSVSDVLGNAEDLREEIEREEGAVATTEAVDAKLVDRKRDATKAKQDGKLIVAEEVAVGHVSWKSMNLLFASQGGSHSFLFWTTFIGFMFIGQIFLAAQTWWMGWWSEQYTIRDSASVNIAYYLGIFVCLCMANLGTELFSLTVYVFGILRAAKTIHRMLIESILGTTMRWLDVTPTSRVIARCTQDINSVDGNISSQVRALADMGTNMIVKVAGVVFVAPAFLVPSLALAGLGGYIGNMYTTAELPIKREQSNTKAPILGHISSAIGGLTSIRAYGAQNAFRLESYTRIDRYTIAARTAFNLNRWVSVRIDVLGGLFAAGLGAYLVYGPQNKISASNTGFALVMAVGFSTLILHFVRVLNMFEVEANALERINAYLHIEREPKPVNDMVPPASWPTSGALCVEDLSARYSLDGPRVLHGLSFNIKSGERIGIVGRTGSGKSSLTLSLLRCILTEGKVFYDGMETNKINLDVLRSNITIIPQVPELLSGTLRENLDPFCEHDDATLNSALRSAGLFSLQNEGDDARITLDSEISSGGGNLSLGQRQILALARALVRGSKLLILDEATSSIDFETDSVIQSSLRTELCGDVTLLIVAHRLQTIMDADKIMVLDAGHIVEFDKPSILLQKDGGYLKTLVDESGDRDALISMAEGSCGETTI